MALKKCRECGKEISSTAKACPHCGASPKKRTSLVTTTLTIAVTCAALFWCMAQMNQTETEPTVRWEKYDASVKKRIDGLAQQKGCEKLQAEFDTAERNSSVTRRRTGSGNSALMAYINYKMEQAGCYR